MRNPIKAVLYTTGTLLTAFLTLAAGNRICEKKEQKKRQDETKKS